MRFELTATCLFGLERLLGEEIEALGYDRTETIDGRVSFWGDEEAVAYANVFLRYAERVYIKLGDFDASSFDALFEGTRALPWENFIGRDDAFPVNGHSVKSALFSIPDCQKIVKKAIVSRLSESYGISWFDESATTVRVEFFILRDRASLMIDTSGEPLHKRGYRPASGLAPIRETLAAAIAALARPREDVLFWDPMCGSGTIAIEAAMLMRNIAPGRNRSFAAESYPFIPHSLWSLAREEAFAAEVRCDFEVFASDIDPEMIPIAAENARRAGCESNVRCFVADAREISAPGRRGTIVTNPPYGERLSDSVAVEALYREIGAHFRSLAPWQVYVITSHPSFDRFWGRRADKVRKLYNGMIPCYFYQYFKNQTNHRH